MIFIRYFIILGIVVNLNSCSKKEEKNIDISHIEVNIEVKRFDQKFYSGGEESLANLKSEFSYLFPEPNPDSIWLEKMRNKDELFLFESSQELYADFSEVEEEINDVFRHVKYYFPKFDEPKVITILSNIDYANSVVYADSLLFVSLDVYLGKDHEVYQDYPTYIKQNFNKNNIAVDVAEEVSTPIMGPAVSKTFVSNIVQEGKKLKLMESFLPNQSKNEIIGYTEGQYQWAEISESDIWKYFIQNEILYDNDPTLTNRFIEDAPFSKFYLEVDKDSPGRLGVWFGWQIVNSFMEHNEVELQEMILLDNEELFKRSKYKPRKK